MLPSTPPPGAASPTASQLALLLDAVQRLGAPLDPESAQASVIAGALRLTRAERAAIFRQDGEHHVLVFVCGRNENGDPLPEDAFRQEAIAARDAVVLGHAVSAEAWAATPLIQSDSVTGAVLVTGGELAEDAALLLGAFAPHAAACLDTARRFARLSRQISAQDHERITLQLLENRYAHSLSVEEVLTLTVEWAVRQTQARSGWIGLVDDDAQPPVVWVMARQGASGTRPLSQPERRSSDDAVVAAGLTAEHSLALPAASSVSPARIVAPIRFNERTTALLVVERPTHAFGSTATAFLDRLAALASLALDSAQQRVAVRRTQDARADFVRTVAHEIRLPMTSIRGYSDLLLAGAAGPINDQQRGFLNTISNNVARMAALVTDLSDVARIDAGRIKIDLRAVDVPAVIASTLASLSKISDARHLTMHVEAPVDLPPARCDAHRLGQVLTHLIGNAIRYSPESSDVTIQVAWLAATGCIRIAVVDHGIGISLEDQSRLFTPFFRSDDPRVRQEPGWGLGLHLCSRLIQVLGGTLTIDSAPGQGTTAAFALPIDSA